MLARITTIGPEAVAGAIEGEVRGPVQGGCPEDVKRNEGIAHMLADGRSWSFIYAVTGCSRSTVAKVARRYAAA